MAQPTKFFSYTKGTDLKKGEYAVRGAGVSHPKIKDLKKPKWRISEGGAVRTTIGFPKSNKATVGKTAKLMTKRGSLRSGDGTAKNVLV